MPFILKKYPGIVGEKIQMHLLKNLKLGPSMSQKSLVRNRVFDEAQMPYKSGERIRDDYIYIAQFEGHTQGLKAMFQTEDFAIFDKPSGLIVHPNSRHTKYCLLDEVRYHYGEDANLVHRIDQETSGLIMCSKDREIEYKLKLMFEEKKYKKSYITIVKGHLKNEQTINSKIQKENKNIGVRMEAGEEGKEACTIVKPIKYNKQKNITLVEAIPITGRQHQIRVHLYSIGHTILGDPIYGVSDNFADRFLDKLVKEDERIENSGSNRLWLHANYLEFTYRKKIYKIRSQNKNIYEKFESKD